MGGGGDGGGGTTMDDDEVRDGGGRWTKMALGRGGGDDKDEDEDEGDDGSTAERIPASVFRSIGIPFTVAFALGAWLLRRHPSFSHSAPASSLADDAYYAWRVLGYALYLCIESYGSLSVAAFWSYANSTLSLSAAEAWYGTIVACAQVGAIGGSTLAAKYAHGGKEGDGGGELAGVPGLFLLSVGGIGLQMIAMAAYARFFPHPMVQEDDDREGRAPGDGSAERRMRKRVSFHGNVKGCGARGESSTGKPPSALNLILRHNYLLLILACRACTRCHSRVWTTS